MTAENNNSTDNLSDFERKCLFYSQAYESDNRSFMNYLYQHLAATSLVETGRVLMSPTFGTCNITVQGVIFHGSPTDFAITMEQVGGQRGAFSQKMDTLRNLEKEFKQDKESYVMDLFTRLYGASLSTKTHPNFEGDICFVNDSGAQHTFKIKIAVKSDKP